MKNKLRTGIFAALAGLAVACGPEAETIVPEQSLEDRNPQALAELATITDPEYWREWGSTLAGCGENVELLRAAPATSSYAETAVNECEENYLRGEFEWLRDSGNGNCRGGGIPDDLLVGLARGLYAVEELEEAYHNCEVRDWERANSVAIVNPGIRGNVCDGISEAAAAIPEDVSETELEERLSDCQARVDERRRTQLEEHTTEILSREYGSGYHCRGLTSADFSLLDWGLEQGLISDYDKVKVEAICAER